MYWVSHSSGIDCEKRLKLYIQDIFEAPWSLTNAPCGVAGERVSESGEK